MKYILFGIFLILISHTFAAPRRDCSGLGAYCVNAKQCCNYAEMEIFCWSNECYYIPEAYSNDKTG